MKVKYTQSKCYHRVGVKDCFIMWTKRHWWSRWKISHVDEYKDNDTEAEITNVAQ